ncbi:GNAT family N-acetyltransferase [Bacillus atrophaeus]|uniref:GNAT family N-acetyltransferase n=1 Tax=Bacillus atrophaeus TaxID=1452 RepID=UPI001EFB4B40|nr:GNAT family protein [Bacillus atrophaeus]MCG8397438.1 GNAT family N-acetyltransferase [Bacillus atrophaeus]
MFLYKIDDDISLKLPELKDAERVFELTDHSREYLRQWLPWLDETTSVEDTKGFIQSCLKSYAENKSLTTFILYKGSIVGTAGYNQINWTDKVAYIGYWLGKEYQGYGIMTKAAKALTDYAFQELKLNRVDIRAAEENSKSRAIPERLGFVCEGRIRQAEWLYDRYADHIVYGMLADEWTSK